MWLKLLTKILCHNWLAILYFNFKMLPFKQAIHLPFDFYHKIRFNDLSGKVNIKSKKIYRGMIKTRRTRKRHIPTAMFCHNFTRIHGGGIWH